MTYHSIETEAKPNLDPSLISDPCMVPRKSSKLKQSPEYYRKMLLSRIQEKGTTKLWSHLTWMARKKPQYSSMNYRWRMILVLREITIRFLLFLPMNLYLCFNAIHLHVQMQTFCFFRQPIYSSKIISANLLSLPVV